MNENDYQHDEENALDSDFNVAELFHDWGHSNEQQSCQNKTGSHPGKNISMILLQYHV